MELLGFFERVRGLKELKRTGWVIKGVKSPESVADHSFMLAVLAYAYSRRLGLKTDKCVKMALLHDICEAYSGDIPSRIRAKDRTMPDRMKKKLEEEGLKKVTSLLPKSMSDEIRGLWKELDVRKTREAKLVRDLDKLEMCMQALAYSKAEKRAKERKKFAEFFEDGEKNIKTRQIRSVFRRLQAEFLRGAKRGC
jgi:putative hydrolase of HD superfamily